MRIVLVPGLITVLAHPGRRSVSIGAFTMMTSPFTGAFTMITCTIGGCPQPEHAGAGRPHVNDVDDVDDDHMVATRILTFVAGLAIC